MLGNMKYLLIYLSSRYIPPHSTPYVCDGLGGDEGGSSSLVPTVLPGGAGSYYQFLPSWFFAVCFFLHVCVWASFLWPYRTKQESGALTPLLFLPYCFALVVTWTWTREEGTAQPSILGSASPAECSRGLG